MNKNKIPEKDKHQMFLLQVAHALHRQFYPEKTWIDEPDKQRFLAAAESVEKIITGEKND